MNDTILARVAARFRVTPAAIETWIKYGMLQQLGIDERTILDLTNEQPIAAAGARVLTQLATPACDRPQSNDIEPIATAAPVLTAAQKLPDWELSRRVFGWKDMNAIERDAILNSLWNGKGNLSADRVFEILRRSNIIAKDD